MLGLRAEAGLSPRRATHFSLLRQRKVSQREATPSLRPLRFATGQTCVGAVAGCAVELALLLRSAARTTTASQFTKHGRFDAHATPQPPRRRRSQQGWGSRTSEQPNCPSGHRCARPCRRSAWRLRPRDGAERSNGPCGSPLPRVPFWMRLGRAGRGVACASERACFVN